jgi:hypothetical protein
MVENFPQSAPSHIGNKRVVGDMALAPSTCPSHKYKNIKYVITYACEAYK